MNRTTEELRPLNNRENGLMGEISKLMKEKGELSAKLREREEREAKLLEALEFYADKTNTDYDVFNDGSGWEYWNDGDMDYCGVAKQALATPPKKEQDHD